MIYRFSVRLKGTIATVTARNDRGCFILKYDVSRFNNPKDIFRFSDNTIRVNFDQGLFMKYPDGTKRFIKYDESINFLTPVI